jgi:hypothetical protein
MEFKSRAGATDSMPELLQVTKQIELRKQQPKEADRIAASQKQKQQPTATSL